MGVAHATVPCTTAVVQYILYFYAMVGMELFHGTATLEEVRGGPRWHAGTCRSRGGTRSLAVDVGVLRFPCGQDRFAHFESLPGALLVLFQMLTTSNW